jgi:xanthine dehydrogenase YagT iron-sulfur-binding subunit
MVDLDREQPDPGRRALLKGATVSAVLLPTLNVSPPAQASSPKLSTSEPPQASVDLMINGRRERLTLDTRTTLLDTLRHHLGLNGSKKGCDHGQCGACTVLVGNKRVLSCLTLAAMVREPVTTIEGLAAPDGTLHPSRRRRPDAPIRLYARG